MSLRRKNGLMWRQQTQCVTKEFASLRWKILKYTGVLLSNGVGYKVRFNVKTKQQWIVFLRRFSPPLSISLSLWLSTLWVVRFGNDNCRYRYRYRRRIGLLVPTRFWFLYSKLITNPIPNIDPDEAHQTQSTILWLVSIVVINNCRLSCTTQQQYNVLHNHSV